MLEQRCLVYLFGGTEGLRARMVASREEINRGDRGFQRVLISLSITFLFFNNLRKYFAVVPFYGNQIVHCVLLTTVNLESRASLL